MKPFTPAPLALAVLSALAAFPSHADEAALAEVTVTATREGQLLNETPASVGIIKEKALREVKPSHPSEIMSQVSGVWVNVTGGEGHQTAIRQPLSTNPVYLYLEDGIPTRSTGFFNHNALYEVNLPMAGGIEVSKGPGSALYGSDAIGGVINVLTRRPPTGPEAEASVEAGSYGWRRALVTGGTAFGDHAVRADLNLTHTDGWRDRTAYDRQSGTLRWDSALADDAMLKTVATFSTIDQQTAGSSAISLDDYRNNPKANYTPISMRKVDAFRLSTAYEREWGDSLLSITPYYRNDKMDLLANWSLSYDPTKYTTENQSFGAQIKYRQDFAPLRTRLIVGLDLDHSPGSRTENSIQTTSIGTGYTRIFTSYTTGPRVYDYDVTYQGVSPYVHGEISPAEHLRVTAGLRYDQVRYQFDNHFGTTPVTAGGRFYGQVADGDLDFSHLSPKLGATYTVSPALNLFAAYNHAFRAPSEGQLFRPSASYSTNAARVAAGAAQDLDPIKVDSVEIGLRGKFGTAVNYELSFYRMTKKDDILSSKDPLTNATTVTNAGKTLHRGVELGLGAQLAALWRIDTAFSYAKHTYEDWETKDGDFSGKEMAMAPRTIANTRLSFGDAQRGLAQLEWLHFGSWFSNDTNSSKYDSHDVLNLRGFYPLARDLSLFANVHNLADKRYAESTGVNSGFDTFAPGLPRTFTMGLQAKW
ncbi:MAG TPA: TonB-dependent receptor [Azonexus sp.]